MKLPNAVFNQAHLLFLLWTAQFVTASSSQGVKESGSLLFLSQSKTLLTFFDIIFLYPLGCIYYILFIFPTFKRAAVM
jgi:hypothetical protein